MTKLVYIYILLSLIRNSILLLKLLLDGDSWRAEIRRVVRCTKNAVQAEPEFKFYPALYPLSDQAGLAAQLLHFWSDGHRIFTDRSAVEFSITQQLQFFHFSVIIFRFYSSFAPFDLAIKPEHWKNLWNTSLFRLSLCIVKPVPLPLHIASKEILSTDHGQQQKAWNEIIHALSTQVMVHNTWPRSVTKRTAPVVFDDFQGSQENKALKKYDVTTYIEIGASVSSTSTDITLYM